LDGDDPGFMIQVSVFDENSFNYSLVAPRVPLPAGKQKQT